MERFFQPLGTAMVGAELVVVRYKARWFKRTKEFDTEAKREGFIQKGNLLPPHIVHRRNGGTIIPPPNDEP